MEHQVLSPTMQDGEEADLGAEVFGIGGDGLQGFRRGVEEDVIDHLLVLVGDRRQSLRHRKDDMEVLGSREVRSWRCSIHCARARD